MKPGEHKQHVPVFVGSTFEDLKDYRRAVRDTLGQLETVVRGMEYFGSKPGSPVDECLAVVRSCKVYIGIFGMRYGTVPDGHDRSMTHLEYDEAQKCKLPSLIYMIDEESQPVLPKFVETGSGADALNALKSLLRKRHVVSTFTTPDDVARKVVHDVPELLRTIGARVEGELPSAEPLDSRDVLRRFRLLPKMYKGLEVMIEFKMDDFHSVSADDCEALRLDEGATIADHTTLADGSWSWVYASSDVAEQVLDIPKGSTVVATGITVYGTTDSVEFTENGTIRKTEEHKGVKLSRITHIKPPTSKKVG